MGPLGAAVCFCLSTQGGHEDTPCLPTLTTAMNGGQGLIRAHCLVAWELGLTKGRYMTQRQAELALVKSGAAPSRACLAERWRAEASERRQAEGPGGPVNGGQAGVTRSEQVSEAGAQSPSLSLAAVQAAFRRMEQ